MKTREYDPDRDRDSVKRIWDEVGWIQDDKREGLDLLLSSGTAVVADIRETPECLVVNSMGELRYFQDSIPISGVLGVTTSRVCRRRGLATRLTAHAVAMDAARGAMLSGLGIFDQGFYNKLGFGTGVQEVWHHFDPMNLRLEVKPPTPYRIEKDHWSQAHTGRLKRMRGHGSISFSVPETTRAEMVERKKAYGLGYFRGDEITHHLWINHEGYHGPHTVNWMAYQTTDQLLELLALLRDLGDQIYQVKLRQPPQIHLEDLLERPFRVRGANERGRFETKTEAWADWQLRICDLVGCLEKTHLSGPKVSFNLELTDPIRKYLDASSPWQGIGGDYVVTLGSNSAAEMGRSPSLPVLRAGVGAFTRLWLGVRTAASLAITDELEGPEKLLDSLDNALAALPTPHPDWDF